MKTQLRTMKVRWRWPARNRYTGSPDSNVIAKYLRKHTYDEKNAEAIREKYANMMK